MFKKSFAQKLFGCQTLHAHVIPENKELYNSDLINEGNEGNEGANEGSNEGANKDSDEVLVQRYIEDRRIVTEWGFERISNALFRRNNNTYVVCENDKGETVFFDLEYFFNKNTVYCSNICSEPVRLSIKTWAMTFDGYKFKFAAKNNNNSDTPVYHSAAFKDIAGPIRNILTRILYSCNGLKIDKRLNFVDYLDCAVYCVPNAEPIPSNAFASDLMPRRRQATCRTIQGRPFTSLVESCLYDDTTCGVESLDTPLATHGLRIDADFACVYDMICLSNNIEMYVNVYVLDQQHRATPAPVFHKTPITGAPTFTIRPDRGGHFELFLQEAKTYILCFVSTTEQIDVVNVTCNMRPYLASTIE